MLAIFGACLFSQSCAQTGGFIIMLQFLLHHSSFNFIYWIDAHMPFIYVLVGSHWKNVEKYGKICGFFLLEVMAGSGKYSTGGYSWIGV